MKSKGLDWSVGTTYLLGDDSHELTRSVRVAGTDVAYQRLQVDQEGVCLNKLERTDSADEGDTAVCDSLWGCFEASWKAVLTALVALAAAVGMQTFLPSVHMSRYLVMETTVVDYPAAFEVKSEYRPECDTRSSSFQMRNRDFLEKLQDFSFVFFSMASIVNMLTEVIKTASAVLMPPVKPIPDADQFIPDTSQPGNVALRRCPANRFVTLGSLVPSPQYLWRSGPDAMEFTQAAQELIAFVQGGLLEGQRSEGSEFSPADSVNVLMEAPHSIKLGGMIGFFPWSMQTACYLFPIQLISLLYDLIADSLLRNPDYLLIVTDKDKWWVWFQLSFRHEMLLPMLLQVLRIHISVDNLRAFFRGMQGASAGRVILSVACCVALLPKLLIFLPALLVTFLIGLPPTWAACTLLERTTGRSYWHEKEGPHVGVLYCFVLPAAALVNRIFYQFSAGTYLCTHSRASLIPLQQGHLTMDAPLLCFVISMFFCSLAVLVPLRFLLAFFPETCGRGVFAFLSPAGFYIRWLENPLYDTRSLRLDREGYEEHRRHFFKEGTQDWCRYCEHLIKGETQVELPQTPAQAFMYDGLQQCWELPCLLHYLFSAQRGAVSAMELLGVIETLRSRQSSVRRLRSKLDVAYDFAVGLQKAEQHRRSYLEAEEHIRVIDGEFGPSTKKALVEFLMQQGELSRSFSTPNHKATWGQDACKALQSYLKRIGFYTGPLNGQLDDVWTVRALRSWLLDVGFIYKRWLVDRDGELGRWTTIALQRFLISTHERAHGNRYLAVNGQWTVDFVFAFQDFLARSGTASPRTGTWRLANTKAVQEFLIRRGYLIGQKQPSDDTDEIFDEQVCRALQCWLRDQGFPCGLNGENADGVDGKFDTGTKLALQLFLKSDRAMLVHTDLITNGKWRAETIRRMQDFLSEDNSNLEVNGLWDLASGQALQAFLKSQGRYVSFVDGDFGGVSVQSLQAWLRDEGFSCGNDGPRCDGVSGNWTKDTTAALQRFLNSRKASAGVDAPAIWSDEYADLKASCWAMALFGGAENYMEEDALELLPPADVEKGRKAAEARQLLRDSGLAVPFGEWWGAAQLLSNLGSGTWLDAAGSEAAVAAVIALQSLESADEAPEGVFEMGIASLLSHLRVGSMQAVEASCAALGRLADMHLLQVEVHDSARKILALRLRANSAIHAAVARGLTSMKSLVSQLWPVLRERLSCSSDGLDVKIAAEALASLDWERLLPEHVLSSCADILGPRLHEEDWLMRVGACHGLAVFGRKASGPYLDPILQLVDDEEGPVVGAAAYAVSQLMDGRNGRLLGVVRRLQARLPDAESDSWVRAGACQGLGLLGVVDDDTISVLSAHLTDTEVIVVEAAAEALCNLQMMNAIDLKVVEDQARETSKRLHHSDWLTRWAACICLGALGAAAQPYLQELKERVTDEDENRVVHDAAKMSLARLHALQRSERSLDRVQLALSGDGSVKHG
mmetsp:Transcript_20980/g.49154  ORF Transcript_20980/g.49154 Transcript_20980/m.49154 type:complete len:1470 (-) Transcript_20980:325-4734(-)